MDGLLLLAAEILIIGVSAWVVMTEAKTPEEITRILDAPPKPHKERFRELKALAARPSPRPGRPGARR